MILLRLYFNSRPREGANDDLDKLSKVLDVFQFTPPRGGKLRNKLIKDSSLYFNSRPREGANEEAHTISDQEFFISIHAPARGQTSDYVPMDSGALISIHAPARGQTYGRSENHRRIIYFNSRPREGANPPPKRCT